MLIDVHCHINLYLVLDEILRDSTKEGVNKIIGVSMSELSLNRIIELSKKYKMIYPALGIHPEEVSINKNIEENLDKVTDFIRKNKEVTCCIGEIGLDHHFIKNKELYPLQEKVFKKMLDLAQELSLPVNIHSKGAEEKIFELLPSYDLPNVNIHWFSGPEEYLKIGTERGYYFSITPAISYSPMVKKVASYVNSNHLLLESDGPVKFSDITGTPSMLRSVLRKVAQIKKINEENLEQQIEKNTMKVFPKIF
ncbi:MAG: TatD family hydrolase [Candidatus Lokiarchaeota archaeon]